MEKQGAEKNEDMSPSDTEAVQGQRDIYNKKLPKSKFQQMNKDFEIQLISVDRG